MERPGCPPSPSSYPLRVLLIQPEWPARALLKADLEGRGLDVLGADTVRLALDLAIARGFRPDAIVVDAVGLSPEPGELDALKFLRGRAPLLLLLSSQFVSPYSGPLSPTKSLSRPFTVDDVARELLSVLAK